MPSLYFQLKDQALKLNESHIRELHNAIKQQNIPEEYQGIGMYINNDYVAYYIDDNLDIIVNKLK